MGSVAVVYVQTQTPLRTSIEARLAAFREYGMHHVTYVNALVPGAGLILARLRADLIIIDTTLLDARFNDRLWPTVRNRLRSLNVAQSPTVLLPQDEYFDTDAVVELAKALQADMICSVAPESEWPLIYGEVPASCKIVRVLTGYLDDATVRHVQTLRHRVRPAVDIGYRAWRGEPFLGRHGLLKSEIGRRVALAAPAHGITTDIQLQYWGENLIGDAWWRSLLSSRWVLGVEGGASILDRDGSLRVATRLYMAKFPQARFEEVEATCFPGRDGELDFKALSPRHLEACVTRTGQILIEGDYNGLLRPWDHYLPMKSDFSNLDDVLELTKDEKLRSEMVERAFRDVVQSGVADYGKFIGTVLSAMPPHPDDETVTRIRKSRLIKTFSAWSMTWVLCRSYVRAVVLRIRRTARLVRARRVSPGSV